MRVFEELRGSFASFSCAANRSSGAIFMFSVIDFRLARLAAYCATIFSRFALRLIWIFFAIFAAVRERELEALEKLLGFLVGLRRCVDDDVHAPDRFRLVVIDFDEHDVLLHAHGVVAAAIEALRVKAA